MSMKSVVIWVFTLLIVALSILGRGIYANLMESMAMSDKLIGINRSLLNKTSALQKEVAVLNIELLKTEVEKLDQKMIGLDATLAIVQHIADNNPSNVKAKQIISKIRLEFQETEIYQEEKIKKLIYARSLFMRDYLF